MKYKLTEVNFKDLHVSNKDLPKGTVVNISYCGESLEFQTPKMCIQEIIKRKIYTNYKNT